MRCCVCAENLIRVMSQRDRAYGVWALAKVFAANLIRGTESARIVRYHYIARGCAPLERGMDGAALGRTMRNSFVCSMAWPSIAAATHKAARKSDGGWLIG
jgi:hypothetical protein